MIIEKVMTGGNVKKGNTTNWDKRDNRIVYRDYFTGNSFDTNNNIQLRLIVDSINSTKIDAKFYFEPTNKIFIQNKLKEIELLEDVTKFQKEGLNVNIEHNQLFTNEKDIN